MCYGREKGRERGKKRESRPKYIIYIYIYRADRNEIALAWGNFATGEKRFRSCGFALFRKSDRQMAPVRRYETIPSHCDTRSILTASQ